MKINSIASCYLFLIAWLWGFCTFSDSGQLEVLAFVKIRQVRNYLKKKSCSTINIFSLFKYVLYQNVLSKYLKKKSGVTVLVPSQTAVKGGHGFENAVRMENLRGEDWDETQNGAHRVRGMHLISSLLSVVFMCLILLTLKFILGKSKKIIKNEVSQDLMRF